MSSPKRPAFEAKENDEEEDTPLHHLRPFGTGLYKQQIKFVPASDGNLDSTSSTSSSKAKPKLDVADLYLNMVLANKAKDKQPEKEQPPSTTDITKTSKDEPQIPPPPQQVTCPTCHLPYTPTPLGLSSHQSSFAHQSRLPHSFPPSALDRTRMGLKTLSAQGWDPDARQGLGPSQQGIQFPIKPKKKDDHLGLGIEVPKGGVPVPKKKEKLLDAKKVRKMQEQEKKRGERIQRELWGRGPDLERYLGKGNGGSG
ncbi:hypothetical protein B0T20DRAFT_436760 [Sordaria brevicollis]|uniref:G-patch domain-containing protein n=1 Tax=Sordaria brevicollis TaxID=83679 RepID=A0AAE0PDY9_SORBR|nr:hypothetical protein B0T20DRAFT_436760 [Sordaria brevicollis]